MHVEYSDLICRDSRACQYQASFLCPQAGEAFIENWGAFFTSKPMNLQNITRHYSCCEITQAPFFTWLKVVTVNDETETLTRYVAFKTSATGNDTHLTRPAGTL